MEERKKEGKEGRKGGREGGRKEEKEGGKGGREEEQTSIYGNQGMKPECCDKV